MIDRIQEYDDGFDSAESFERAGADQPDACEERDDEGVLQMTVEDYESILERVQIYNRTLNQLEISPNGDDYNNLLDILAGGRGIMPHIKGR